MTPLAWCAPLAAASDDVLGAVVRAVCARMAPRTPGLLRIGHRREQQLVEVEFTEGGRTKREERSLWWLHIGVVFDGEAALDPRAVEDTHPALARHAARAAAPAPARRVEPEAPKAAPVAVAPEQRGLFG